MLQRIQSIYLLAATILTAIGLYFSYVICNIDNISIVIKGFSIEDTASLLFTPKTNLFSLGITVIITTIGNAIAIFLYKKRLFQITIIKYIITLQIFIVGIVGYFIFIIMHKNSDISISPGISSILLLIAIILNWLAIKNIKKDEDLIRSIDRIR